MFIAALFLRAKQWQQPKCPSADDWINKIWPIPRIAKTLGRNTLFKPLHWETWPNFAMAPSSLKLRSFLTVWKCSGLLVLANIWESSPWPPLLRAFTIRGLQLWILFLSVWCREGGRERGRQIDMLKFWKAFLWNVIFRQHKPLSPSLWGQKPC